MRRIFVTLNINGTIRVWHIDRYYDSNTTKVQYYQHDSQKIVETIIKENITAYGKRIKDKLKTGYVEVLNDSLNKNDLLKLLKDNAVNVPFKEAMKCQKYDPSKFKYPCMGQPKLNGVRCYVVWGIWEYGQGVFKESKEGVILLSNGGNRYEVPHIANRFIKEDFYNEATNSYDLYYDGELYVHGESLNIIKSRIPIEIEGILSKSKFPSTPVKFYCFDIAIDDTVYIERLDVRKKADIFTNSFVLVNVDSNTSMVGVHEIATSNIVEVGDTIINNLQDAEQFTTNCIAMGFEGSVLRTFDNIYQYGKRPNDIIKIKRYKDGEFKVVDIVPKPQGGCLFVCRNDINSETFECNPMGSYPQQEQWLLNKDNIIGKQVTVKYYERSGVTKCPWHANVVTVRINNN